MLPKSKLLHNIPRTLPRPVSFTPNGFSPEARRNLENRRQSAFLFKWPILSSLYPLETVRKSIFNGILILILQSVSSPYTDLSLFFTYTMSPTKQQVLSLYREFVRNSSKFSNYNFRSYFLRRSRDAFKQGKLLDNAEQVDVQFQKAREELEVLKRQSKISQMYTFEKLVVEPLDHHHRAKHG